jgi:hypothetical protein
MIGSETDLTGIRELAEQDAVERAIEVGRAADDDRALAAELEGDGHEVLRRRFHDLAADRSRSREHQVIERQPRERLRDLGSAAHDCDLGRVEIS